MLQHALKEWAVICEALGQGKQSLLLRKGGLVDDEFTVEQTRFWLYPTYWHQQFDGVQDEAKPLLRQIEIDRPPAGCVRLHYWAELTGVYQIREILPALMLSHLHCWTAEAVRKRFDYRSPGLNLLVVRVYRPPKPCDLEELPAYDGCRSWVELERPIATDGSAPVLSDADFHLVNRQLDLLLSPTALA